MTEKFRTEPIKTAFPHVHLAYLEEATGLTGTLTEKGLVIEFEEIELALAGLAKAKEKTWVQYLKQGGNPRNKRGHGAIFTAVAKAITKEAQ